MSIVHLDLSGDVSAGSAPASDAELVTALRTNAAEALERAYDFLQGQPDSWAILRAQVLCGAKPVGDLTGQIEAGQAGDGSLPITTLISGGGIGFPAIDLAALDAESAAIVGTLEGLLMAADAKSTHADWVSSAARFLESRQAGDGAFRLQAVTGPPLGDDVDVFWTGMVAGILGRTLVSRPKMLEAAGEFLATRFTPDAVEHDGFSALIAYAHFFTNVAHDLGDEALQWCGRALEKGFRSREVDAVSTLRVLLTCDAQALPGATFDVAELLEHVLEEQAGDGGFAELSERGADARTTQTFDAMLAIVKLCGALDD